MNLDAHMGDVRDHYAELARAAIGAMRAPTERMEFVGGTKCEEMMFNGDPDFTGVIFKDMGRVYSIMIDEALHQ